MNGGVTSRGERRDQIARNTAQEPPKTTPPLKRCPYCGREHERRGAVYCSEWCARKGAAHNAAAARQRNRALAVARARAQERVRWVKQWRQIAMGDASPLAAIFNPDSRARRRKRLKTGK